MENQETKKNINSNKLEKIYFPVEKISMQDLVGDETSYTSDCSHAVRIFPEAYPNGLITYIGSNRYEFYENKEIIPIIQEVLKENNHNYQIEVITRESKQFNINFILEKHKPFNGGTITTVVSVHNSYDGKIQLTLGISTYYLTEDKKINLTNSPKVVKLIENKEIKTSFSQKHTNLKVLKENLSEVMSNLTEYLKVDDIEDFQKMLGKKVTSNNLQEYLEQLCKDTGYPFSKLYTKKKGVEEINEVFQTMLIQSGGGSSQSNKFAIYMALHEFLHKYYNYTQTKYSDIMSKVMKYI